MKIFTLQIAFIFGLCGLINNVYSQTIPADVLPAIGDTIQSVLTEGDDVDEGPAGTGVTWDFSFMTPGPQSDPVLSMYVHPEDTPFAAEFPAANLAHITPTINGNTYSYYILANNRLEYVGAESAGTFIDYQADPQLILDASLSAGNLIEDTFRGTTMTTMNDIETYGEATFEVDASGTLILPSGIYNNAVRMLTTTERVDSNGTDNFTSVTTLQITSYIWFVPGQLDAVMAVVYTEGESVVTVMGNPPTTTEIPLTKSVVYNPDPEEITSGTQELPGVQMAQLSPNPTNDIINIQLEVEEAQIATLAIRDVTGHTVFTKKVNLVNGNFQQTVDMSSFPAGHYFLSIHNEKGISTSKIIKNAQ